MKYIKFFLSDKSSITMDQAQAEEMLRSQNQIFAIKEDGKWTGETINKAFIIRSCVDTDKKSGWKDSETLRINGRVEDEDFKPIQDISKFMPDSLKQFRNEQLKEL